MELTHLPVSGTMGSVTPHVGSRVGVSMRREGAAVGSPIRGDGARRFEPMPARVVPWRGRVTMAAWTEVVFGIFDGIIGVALTVVAVFYPQYVEQTCTSGGCTSSAPTIWQQQPVVAIVYLLAGVVASAALVAVFFVHSRRRSLGLLVVLWLLAVGFFGCVYLLAFTIFGEAAFFLGLFTVVGAIAGSVVQVGGRDMAADRR